jgi:hypothetical protein
MKWELMEDNRELKRKDAVPAPGFAFFVIIKYCERFYLLTVGKMVL